MSTLTRTAGTALTCLLLALGCACVVSSTAGVRLLPVLTGSMAPHVPAGSLVLTTRIDPSQVQVGDVVAFRPPHPHQVPGERAVFHRVATVDRTAQGRSMTTWGDTNPTADPWQVSLEGADLARGALVLPHLGHLFAGGRPAAALILLSVLALVAGCRALVTDRREGTARSCTCSTHDTLATAAPTAVEVPAAVARTTPPPGPATTSGSANHPC